MYYIYLFTIKLTKCTNVLEKLESIMKGNCGNLKEYEYKDGFGSMAGYT